MMKTHTLTRLAVTLLVMALAVPTLAQSSIKQVPAEAALYVGWRGTTDMGPDYEGSNLQGVIEETGLLEALPGLIDAIQNFAEEEGDPEVELVLGMGGTLWSALWSNGGAMYMLPPEGQGPPIPRLAFLINKGDDAEAVQETLDNLVKMMEDNAPVPTFTGTVGNTTVFSIGFDATKPVVPQSLDTSAKFKAAASKVQGDGALVVYADVKQWIKQVDQVAEMMKQQAEEFDIEPEPFAMLWPTLREASGLAGVNRLMLTAGIKDKNWHTRMFLDAPSPRKGVLSLLDNPAIKDASLTHVPKSSTYLQVFSLDSVRLLDVVRDMMIAVDPNIARQMDSGLEELSQQVGFDFEKELLRGMGPVWSVYIDPMIAGNGMGSMVFVNELTDAKSVEKSMAKLTAIANAMMADAVQDAPFNIRLLTREVKGTDITYLGIPYVAPAMMVHDGKLYVSLFPQGLEMALEQSGEKQDSILANPAFTKTMGRFGGKGFTGLSFVDLPETAPDGYGFNLMLMQTISGSGEMLSGKPTPMRMPPVGKLMPFIQPSGTINWVDDQGLHVHSIEPFPASALMGPAKGLESTMAISGPMAVAVMLPALGSARAAAMDVQTSSQARMLTIAAITYAAENEDTLPTDIADLREFLADDSQFFSPNSMRAEAMPFNFDDWNQARQDQFVRKNSSFVLVPLGKMSEIEEPSKAILFFQRPDDTDGDIVVGYADGHVTSVGVPESIDAILKQQAGKSISQLIKQQEKAGE